MSDAERFREKSRAMIRLAGMAMTPLERRSYVDLAAAWSQLADQALTLDARAAALGEVVVPFSGRFLTDPPDRDPEPET